MKFWETELNRKAKIKKKLNLKTAPRAFFHHLDNMSHNKMLEFAFEFDMDGWLKIISVFSQCCNDGKSHRFCPWIHKKTDFYMPLFSVWIQCQNVCILPALDLFFVNLVPSKCNAKLLTTLWNWPWKRSIIIDWLLRV